MLRTGDAPALAVSVAAFRRATGFIEPDAEADLQIESYLRAAQEVVEAGTNRPLGPRAVRLSVPAWPSLRRWWVPCAPVVEVTALRFLHDRGEALISVEEVALRMPQDEPQIVFPAGVIPGGGEGVLEVEAVVGADEPDVRLVQAIILIAKEWREANIAIDQTAPPRATFGARALMRQARYQRPAVMTAGH